MPLRTRISPTTRPTEPIGAERTIVSSVHCHRCGARLTSHANFCPACGASMARDTSEDTLTLDLETGAILGASDSLVEEIPAGVDVLLVQGSPTAGARFALEGQPVSAGRSPDSVIFLDDVTVSRRHVTFARTESGRPLVRDLGSLNGTYVNGVRVDEKLLESGDEIQVGKFKLTFIAGADR